jgi:hypothetical protein
MEVFTGAGTPLQSVEEEGSVIQPETVIASDWRGECGPDAVHLESCMPLCGASGAHVVGAVDHAGRGAVVPLCNGLDMRTASSGGVEDIRSVAAVCDGKLLSPVCR